MVLVCYYEEVNSTRPFIPSIHPSTYLVTHSSSKNNWKTNLTISVHTYHYTTASFFKPAVTSSLITNTHMKVAQVTRELCYLLKKKEYVVVVAVVVVGVAAVAVIVPFVFILGRGVMDDVTVLPLGILLSLTF